MTLIAGCCAAVLALTACDPDKPDPNYSSVTPTPSISTTPTPIQSPSPNTTANVPSGAAVPTLPSSAAARSSDGALQFAGYYWRMVDWAYSTNSGNVIQNLYLTSCASCASFMSSINDSAASGYTLIGGHIAIKSLTLRGTDDVTTAEYGVDVALQVDALEARTVSGAVATTYPAATPTYRMYLGWIDGSWRIVETATVTTR